MRSADEVGPGGQRTRGRGTRLRSDAGGWDRGERQRRGATGRWGRRAEVGAVASERALTCGTSPSARENGAARNAGWRGVTGGPGERRRCHGPERREGRAESWAAALARALALSGKGSRARETGHAGREGRVSGWAAGPRGKEVGRQVGLPGLGWKKKESGPRGKERESWARGWSWVAVWAGLGLVFGLVLFSFPFLFLFLIQTLLNSI